MACVYSYDISLLSCLEPPLARLCKAFLAHTRGDARLVNYFRWIDRSDLLALLLFEARAPSEEPMLSFFG